MFWSMRHGDFGCVKCHSPSHMHTNRISSFSSLFLNSLHLSLQIPMNLKIYLVIHCQLALAGLSGRGPYSPSPSSAHCWPRIRHLTCPFETWCWLKNWTHWTETAWCKTAGTAHNSFPAKGYEFSSSHISFLMGLFHWLSWKPKGFGSNSSFNGAHLLVKQKRAIA